MRRGDRVGRVERDVDAFDAAAVDQRLEVPGDVGGGEVSGSVVASWSHRPSLRRERLGQAVGVDDGQRRVARVSVT